MTQHVFFSDVGDFLIGVVSNFIYIVWGYGGVVCVYVVMPGCCLVCGVRAVNYSV